MDRKLIQFKVADDAKGLVVAEIATLNVLDRDRDITLPGFFGKQTNVPMLWGHDSRMMPIGIGDIHEEGDKAIFDGRLNLDMQAGQEAFAALKFMGSAQDWSYGYALKQGGYRYANDEVNGEHRLLQPLEDGSPGSRVLEVSPVLIGAGVNTGTREVKEDHRERLVAHTARVAAELGRLDDRLREVADLRAVDGKQLGSEVRGKLADLIAVAQDLTTYLEDAAGGTSPATDNTDNDDARVEYLRFQQYLAAAGG